MLEMAEICGSNPAGPFLQTKSFCAFSDYRLSVDFSWLRFRSSMILLYSKLL